LTEAQSCCHYFRQKYVE